MTDAHTHASIGTGTVLPVVESFYTVQGEGVNTGKAAWFIRLGGCDVRCPWCDSRNSWDAASFPLTDIEDIVRPITGSPAVNVVITGGEPLMHDLDPLCGRLKEKGYNIFLETSGTHPLSGVFDWICVSPKKHRPPLQEVLEKADELKAVAGCGGYRMGRGHQKTCKDTMRPAAAARVGTEAERHSYYNRICEGASGMENIASDTQIPRHTLKLNTILSNYYQTNN